MLLPTHYNGKVQHSIPQYRSIIDKHDLLLSGLPMPPDKWPLRAWTKTPVTHINIFTVLDHLHGTDSSSRDMHIALWLGI